MRSAAELKYFENSPRLNGQKMFGFGMSTVSDGVVIRNLIRYREDEMRNSLFTMSALAVVAFTVACAPADTPAPVAESTPEPVR